MTIDLAWLVLAGVGAGLCGSIAGLASLVSYPALLAFGLPPLAANVTNTTAMFATTTGSVLGSQPELRGQGRRVVALMLQCIIGGALGAVLLLVTPAEAFEVVVPWLVALGAVLLLARDRIRAWAESRRARQSPDQAPRRWWWPTVIVVTAVYGGYFGAGVGIIMLAVLAVRHTEPLAITNAVKNVGTGTANGVAAIAYVFLAPVDWPAALALGAGALVGSALGPRVVRVAPERPLRYAIGVAGLGLAVYLAVR
jgi:uncharacterized membrane protein YfcA